MSVGVVGEARKEVQEGEDICIHIADSGFPSGATAKESTYNAEDARDLGSIPGLGRSPGGGDGNPLQYSCLENPHGLREELRSYHPRDHKESDMTERLIAQSNSRVKAGFAKQ